MSKYMYNMRVFTIISDDKPAVSNLVYPKTP